ncbi:hypothetical protein ACC695_40930, partial [Rhizobium ruizarguesonis]
ASLTSVRACAYALTSDGRPFDVVISNAGVMVAPFGRTLRNRLPLEGRLALGGECCVDMRYHAFNHVRVEMTVELGL